MQVSRISIPNYSSKVSFREMEGEPYYDQAEHFRERFDYSYKRNQINKEYDLQLERLRKNNNSPFYRDAVRNIEHFREQALQELENLFHKSFPKNRIL